MPAIQPKAAIFDDTFTERKHSVSTSAITITRSASSHTVLASIQFTNTEPCDLLAFASIDVRQSGVIARWVRTWLWITLDDMEIGNGMHTIGSFGPDLEPIFTYSAHGALGARKDVAPGSSYRATSSQGRRIKWIPDCPGCCTRVSNHRIL